MKFWPTVAAIGILVACSLPGSPPSPSPSPTGAVAATSAPQDACHVGSVVYCVLNPAVTQATIKQTVCVSGWSATTRPSSSYTSALKLQQIAAEKLPDTN